MGIVLRLANLNRLFVAFCTITQRGGIINQCSGDAIASLQNNGRITLRRQISWQGRVKHRWQRCRAARSRH